MIVLHLTDCPVGLRGSITKWLMEIASGVFVGKVSARVRDEIWAQVQEHCRNGRAVLVFSASGEQRLDFRIHGDTWEPIDFDGIKLILRPNGSRLRVKQSVRTDGNELGFSNASKLRTAKKFSEYRKRFPVDYVILDLETTGLSSDADEIIEIGVIKMLRHEAVDTFSALVLTEQSIPGEVSAMTGIDDQMISEAGMPLDNVLTELISFLGELPIVGHNIDFDKRFLINAYAKCGLPPIRSRCIDTLSLAKRLVRGCENYKLVSLAEEFGITHEERHRSLSDCETTGKLYRKLLDLMDGS